MPQMAPISWLLLFFIFTITFIMFNILNYYCYFSDMPRQSNLNKTSELKNSMNWKW